MSVKATFSIAGRNPDVLTCIANLSNDEVFTPPELANQMLDTLAHSWARSNGGADIWSDPTVKFLDPFTKSGVFLREITARLTVGLAKTIPNLEDRIDHILTKQIFGIGITELTAQIARRSVYCSKFANGQHSIAKSFTNESGNIVFHRYEHTWSGGIPGLLNTDESGEIYQMRIGAKCSKCGARQSLFERDTEQENHAYDFIHEPNLGSYFSNNFGGIMHFDVIIGNPPYQLNDGGGEGAGAVPLYHHFVNQAKALDPRQIVMVTPARWYSGGKGLDDFRMSMLTDGKLAEIHDFPETEMVFPGVNIRGGVSYFVWKQDHSGDSLVVNYRKDGSRDSATRPLLEKNVEVFIRHNQAVSILNKVLAKSEETFDNRVLSRNPFGIEANFSQYSLEKNENQSILLFRSRRGSTKDKEVYISESQIKTNRTYKDRLKVLVSKASPGGDEFPHAIFSSPFLSPENSVSTETYLLVDFVQTKVQGENLIEYMQTKFFRFLVSLIKNTQNISKGSFAFVPVQDLGKKWTDEMLYEKYGIDKAEQAFIDTMIRPTSAEEARDDA